MPLREPDREADMILKLSLDLPENEAYVRITRLLGRTLLEHLQVIEQDVEDIELVVGELCTNVIRHARSDKGRFRVLIEYHHDRVAVTVEDYGKGFSFHDVARSGEMGSERFDTLTGGDRFGGFGLYLVKTLADQLEFHRTDARGATVRAEKQLHYKTVEAAASAASHSGDGAEATFTDGDAPPSPLIPNESSDDDPQISA